MKNATDVHPAVPAEITFAPTETGWPEIVILSLVAATVVVLAIIAPLLRRRRRQMVATDLLE